MHRTAVTTGQKTATRKPAQLSAFRARFLHTLGPLCESRICTSQSQCCVAAAVPAAHAATSPLIHLQHMHNEQMATLDNMLVSITSIPARISDVEGQQDKRTAVPGGRTCGRWWCRSVS